LSGVELRRVAAGEVDLRLDRWFKRHFPRLRHGQLQKLLRTGQVRVDGRRAGSDLRLAPGQVVRVPPLPEASERPPPATPAVRPGDRELLEAMILHRDEALLVLNKPPGLAVQGGTGTRRHVDGLLATLGEGETRPRLVHRLDKDTSGLLVVARTPAAAAKLTEAFRRHRVEKLYWALVVGRPHPAEGILDQPLAKQASGRGERVEADADGRPARTAFRTVARAGKVATWLALVPHTGRTHQLRAHCAALGVPILGDGKYGGAAAKPSGAPPGLMLHAREIRLPHPEGGTLQTSAPLPAPLRAGFDWLGIEPDPHLPGATLATFHLPW
jgi:23S rRNA pseudouridine955/2504/2580 synthase